MTQDDFDAGNNLVKLGKTLEMGGEGKNQLYNKTIPAFLKKYGKKWNAKVYDDKVPIIEKAFDDEMIIPDRFKYIIIDGAMVYMMRFRSNEQSAQIHQAKFQEGIKAMRRLLLDDPLFVRSSMINRPKFTSQMLRLSG